MRHVREVVRADEQEHDRDELVRQLEQEMLEAAQELDFERAAALRDHIKELKESPDVKVTAANARPARARATQQSGTWKPKHQRRRPRKK